MCDFSHLHCHTQYSLLDGAARIKSLIGKASALEMTALGITDHGNLFGVPEFYTSAKKAGVKPIIGSEFYVTASGMDDRGDRVRYHQVLWAKNEEGYQNLIKLSSLSYTEGFYYKPRIDKAALRKYSGGLVATTCCLQGEVLQAILKKDEETARKLFEEYLDIFGEDYYVEIQNHGIPEQEQCNAVLLRWAQEYGVKAIATNDVHYVEQPDAAAQDVLLCLQTGKDLYDPNRMRFENDQFFMKSADEMRGALSMYDPIVRDGLLDTTREIVDKCDLEIPMGRLLMPHYPLPPAFGDDMDAYLKHIVFEGARRRYAELSQDVVERLNFELGVIKSMGYAGYFLIVQDFTTAARNLDVRVGPGRGSAAGSAVAFCLGITNIDPLKYDLLFERFLNPERVSMPDIDIDFDDRGRGKVIDYVVQKYGRENVCQIITFGTMGAKSVIRDVSRVLNLPLSEADRIAKLIPDGVKVNLSSAIKEVKAFAALENDADPQIRKLLHYARVLEGSARHTGVHAAGVIIAPGDVSDYVPVSISKSKGEVVMTTQYDGSWVEEFGLLKMDFLGLKTLTVLNDALALIKANHGVDIDIDEIPLDDDTTFELFRRGETVSIFQFESSGMREWMMKLKPTSLDDLIAMNALYRPGPMDLIPNYIDRKHGREKVDYPHPLLEPVLKATYGIPVYQEQVMQMAQVMAGYSLGQADLLRRAMGKKKISEMQKHREIFREGAKRLHDVEQDHADEIFDMMEKFAGYGFNRCVVGSTEVTDAETGSRTTVLDLFKHRRPFQIHALDDAGRLRKRRVVDVMWNGRKPVYELRTRLGKRITATGNHPFRTLDGWTNLEALQPGDRIAAPRRLRVDSDQRWPVYRLVTLAGLLAEGNLCHPSCLYFYSNTRSQIADFAAHAERFADTVTRIDERTNGRLEVCLSTGRDTRYQPGQTPWNAGGEAVAAKAAAKRSGAFRWVASLGLTGKKATEKFVPADVFALCDADVALFLGRLWAGDGYIAGARPNTPYYATSSEQLARDVQTLLLRLGIVSTIHLKQFKHRDTLRPSFTVSLKGEGVLPAFLEHIAPHIVGREAQIEQLRKHVATTRRGLTSTDTLPAEIRRWVDEARRAARLTWKALGEQSGVSMREFYGAGSPSKRGFPRETIARLAAFFGCRRLEAAATSDVFWDEIVSITPKGVEDTYDLTVDVDHNFVADGLVVHNSHAAAYSVVAYQTAYLKAHYPPEFMAAAMTNEMGDTKKLAVVLEEARHLGIDRLPPSVNHSAAHFGVEDGKIRFGLGAIKGLGLSAIEAFVRAREKNGRFETIFAMMKDVDLRAVNKKAVDSLARSGALDELEGHRAQLVEAVDLAVQFAQKVQADAAAGQNSLFGALNGGAVMEPNLPMVEPWPRSRVLQEERELMGFYMTGHPLEAYQAEARAFASAGLGHVDQLDLPEPDDDAPRGRNRDRGPQHRFCGIITDVQQRTTKTGKPIAFATIEDFTGQGEVICFSSVFDKVQNYLKVDEIILVRGEVELRGGNVKILAQDITPMWKVREQLVKSIVLRVNMEQVQIEQIDQLRTLCAENRGSCKLYFDIEAPDLPHGPQRVHSRKYVVDPTPELMAGMARLFGKDNILLEGGEA